MSDKKYFPANHKPDSLTIPVCLPAFKSYLAIHRSFYHECKGRHTTDCQNGILHISLMLFYIITISLLFHCMTGYYSGDNILITCIIGANRGFHRLISDLMQSMYEMSVMNTVDVCGLAVIIAIVMIYNKIYGGNSRWVICKVDKMKLSLGKKVEIPANAIHN
ncbi:TPA: hypothetical protein ACWL6U_004083 [Morganella morganii]